MSILNERIKQRREALGMSQAELAELLGYSDRSTIAKIEKGTNDITQSKIEAFAEALRTTPAYLMGWENDSGDQDLGLTALDVAKWLNASPEIVETVMEDMGCTDATSPEILSKISAEVERRKIAQKHSIKFPDGLSEADQQLMLAELNRMEFSGQKNGIVKTSKGFYFLFCFSSDEQGESSNE